MIEEIASIVEAKNISYKNSAQTLIKDVWTINGKHARKKRTEAMRKEILFNS